MTEETHTASSDDEIYEAPPRWLSWLYVAYIVWALAYLGLYALGR